MGGYFKDEILIASLKSFLFLSLWFTLSVLLWLQTLSTFLHSRQTRQNTQVKDSFFLFFQMFYRLCENNIITNYFGHNNHVVKICYHDGPCVKLKELCIYQHALWEM